MCVNGHDSVWWCCSGGALIPAKKRGDFIVPVNQGQLLVHSGGLLHGGYPIEEGERYVLVLFYALPSWFVSTLESPVGNFI